MSEKTKEKKKMNGVEQTDDCDCMCLHVEKVANMIKLEAAY